MNRNNHRFLGLPLLALSSLFFLECLASGPAGFAQEKGTSKDPAPARNEPLYIIAPNDILEIFVWK